MPTPPTFVAEYESAWTSGLTKSVTPTLASGDLLVIIGVTEDTLFQQGLPSGGGLTYTLKQQFTAGSYCGVSIWSSSASPSGQSFTLSVTANSAGFSGINALRFSGSSGVGASNIANLTSGAPSLSLTTGGGNSAIVAAIGDWTATAGTGRVWRTVNGITPTAGAGDEVTYFNNANYTAYGAYWSDCGAAGAKTVGMTTPSAQKYAIVGLEVLGSSGPAFTANRPLVAGQSVTRASIY